MNDEQQAPSAIPDGVQGNAVLESLEELRKVGGTLFRSKHHGARQIRKKARLRKRLRQEGKARFRPHCFLPLREFSERPTWVQLWLAWGATWAVFGPIVCIVLLLEYRRAGLL